MCFSFFDKDMLDGNNVKGMRISSGEIWCALWNIVTRSFLLKPGTRGQFYMPHTEGQKPSIIFYICRNESKSGKP